MGCDGAHHAQAGLGAVAGQDDHLDERIVRVGAEVVEAEQPSHERVGNAWPEGVVEVLALVGEVGGRTLFVEHTPRLVQVEQRAGGDADHQSVRQVVARHLTPSLGAWASPWQRAAIRLRGR